jgi:hypothetical protein
LDSIYQKGDGVKLSTYEVDPAILAVLIILSIILALCCCMYWTACCCVRSAANEARRDQ